MTKAIASGGQGVSRRNLFRSLARDVAQCVHSARECVEEAARFAEFFGAPEQCMGISRHYPRELFEEDARRLGIDLDAVDMDEAVRRIFEDRFEREDRAREKAAEASGRDVRAASRADAGRDR